MAVLHTRRLTLTLILILTLTHPNKLTLLRVPGRSQRKPKQWQDYQALIDSGDDTSVTSGLEICTKQGRCWPARATQAVDRPRLAGAWGSLRDALAQ